MANYSCKKFSFTPYSLARVHLLQSTDRVTDGRSMTTMTIARPLLKYGRLKFE